MENQALISVIIPVYNVEEYLRECVDSVLNQTYKNLEIILVDDGSKDSSGKICDEYVDIDERITVIHQRNGGLSVARNTGLTEANGDYVYFLDSDDYIAENALKTLLNIAEKDNSDMVFFDAVSFADTDDFTVNQNYIRKNNYPTACGLQIFSQMTENKEFHSSVPLLFLKKEFLKNTGLTFIPNILYEDMVFTYQAFCEANCVSQCTESLYFRRYRKNSIMTSKKNVKHFSSCLYVYYRNSEYHRQSDAENCTASKRFVSRCAFNVFNVYEKLGTADKKACRSELKKFKKDAKLNNHFNNAALHMRCFGKAFWAIYRIFEKTAEKLLKGTK